MKTVGVVCSTIVFLASCTPPRPPAPDESLERARIAGEAVRTAPRRPPAWRCEPNIPSPLPSPATRAERTGYCETTPYEEAMAFLDTIRGYQAASQG